MLKDSVVLMWISLAHVSSLHVTGVWTANELVTIVAKFGFQQTDTRVARETRGFVYGNVTGANGQQPGVNSLLAVVNIEHFQRIYVHREPASWRETFCARALRAASEVAFDGRCRPNGRQDFFRNVPCKSGELCAEEDEPTNVIKGHQLTYQIEDKAQARFWFVLLLNCHLDESCNWTLTNENRSTSISYDLWLVNGDPASKWHNPFEHQFSFEEMDTFEIFLAALTLNAILIALQWRTYRNHRSRRAKSILYILIIQLLQIAVNLIHVCVFASNGAGLKSLITIGDLLQLTADFALTVLLICLAKGWTINAVHISDRRKVLMISAAYYILLIVFYSWASNVIDNLFDVDRFQTWPGWAMLLLRILVMVWFLIELRHSVRGEYEENKASFLIHFGAGFLVWFIYLPVLGALSAHIHIMWRYKLITCIVYLADFVAYAILIHLFWHNSSNKNYFLHSSSTEELDDFERSIMMEDLNGITHVEEVDSSKERNISRA